MEPRPQTTIVCDKNECRIARRSAFRVYEPSPQYSYQQMTYAIDRAKSSYALSSAHNLSDLSNRNLIESRIEIILIVQQMWPNTTEGGADGFPAV
ncbi:hypothetical protein AC249_AIPGENE14259 [Exaiptasia diaphana]|nr:hypothetical protein AC249_AIPGENE14259 [Exaiptasia diaphana]